mgnify:CR=1 FL=1
MELLNHAVRAELAVLHEQDAFQLSSRNQPLEGFEGCDADGAFTSNG